MSHNVNRPYLRACIHTIVGTLYLAFLVSLSRRSNWGGYAAGTGDHTVLMPQGIRGAIPDAFKNDWFIDAAPQPHWFFDFVVQFGVRSGSIDALLLCYWLIGLAAFVLATVLFSRLVVARFHAFAVFTVLTLAGLAPWGLFGTGTGTIGMALPTVLAGNLIYLSIVLIIRKNFIAAASVGAAVAIVHVQQGAIISVIFTVTLVMQYVLQRKVQWALLLGLLLNAGFVVFGLRLRPVAANPKDFVEICDQIIPYHCSISQWEWTSQAAALGGVFAAALTVLAVRRSARSLWFSTAGLVTLGYVLGFLADALRIPVLGDLAQSVNANRLGSVVVPFMLWGMALPLLRLRMFSQFRKRSGSKLFFTGIWLAAIALVLVDMPWSVVPFVLEERWLTLGILGAGTLALVAARKWFASAVSIALVAILLSFVVASGLTSGTLSTSPKFNWYDSGASSIEHRWYLDAGEVVPPGEVITAPGNSEDLRLISQRATIADCKNVPYGGEAWAEWKSRIYDFGINCRGSFGYAADVSVDSLEALASKYDSRFVVVEHKFARTHADEIAEHGWLPRLEANTKVPWWLYELPK